MMKTTISRAPTVCTALAAALALLPAGSPWATTLWAGPLDPAPGLLHCFAANVSSKPLDIEIAILAANGTPSAIVATLNPGQTAFNVAKFGNDPKMCKVTFTGAKNKVRATACVSTADQPCVGGGLSAK